MSRRKTVQLNLEFVRKRIKEVCRSNVVFCEAMGRAKQKTWVTGWGINKNLPSPEEAARMCAILQVSPEDILVEPDDIQLVRGLIDGQKEKPVQNMDELDEETKELRDIWDTAAADERKALLEMARFIKSKRK